MTEKEYVEISELKKLRACCNCGLIKNEKQFKDSGCENCPDYNNGYSVFEYTTSNFEGMIAIMDNKSSWVSRYKDLANHIPGCYALRKKNLLENN